MGKQSVDMSFHSRTFVLLLHLVILYINNFDGYILDFKIIRLSLSKMSRTVGYTSTTVVNVTIGGGLHKLA